MGQCIDGVWHEGGFDVEHDSGGFVRRDSSFRSFVTADGSSGFKAEAGRYHLYVSYACPWAHRTLIARVLLGLEDVVSVSVVHPFLDHRGWHFEEIGRASWRERV